jgi:hypothetical protein
MLTSDIDTVTTIPILELRAFERYAAFSVKQPDKMVCEVNADIYGKGFFGMKRKFVTNYI